jgi:hypothetical protein
MNFFKFFLKILKYYAEGKTVGTGSLCRWLVYADGDWAVPDQILPDEKTPTVTVNIACIDGLPYCANGWRPSADSQSPVVPVILPENLISIMLT